jgi:hypothetical protein
VQQEASVVYDKLSRACQEAKVLAKKEQELLEQAEEKCKTIINWFNSAFAIKTKKTYLLLKKKNKHILLNTILNQFYLLLAGKPITKEADIMVSE